MITETHTHTNRCWWRPDEARWVCRPAADPDTPLVDVRDMLVVHTALLREFRLAPGAVRRVADRDRRQASVVERHLAFLCELLHHHHEGEDALLWPLLRERLTDAALDHLDDVAAQHVDIDAALADVVVARGAWVAFPSASTRQILVADLERLSTLLRVHLDLEESAVLPLAAVALTEGEWAAVGEAAVAAMPKPALALAFGMFAYEAEPAVLRMMLAAAPAVPRMLLPRVAPRLYARRARAVYGTRCP